MIASSVQGNFQCAKVANQTVNYLWGASLKNSTAVSIHKNTSLLFSADQTK